MIDVAFKGRPGSDKHRDLSVATHVVLYFDGIVVSSLLGFEYYSETGWFNLTFVLVLSFMGGKIIGIGDGELRTKSSLLRFRPI